MNTAPVQLSPQETAALGMVIVFVLVLVVIMYVVRSIVVGKLFKKAGQPAWKAWVPVYWHWIFLQLGGQAGYWSVVGLIPVINLVAYVFTCISMYHIGLKLQKDSIFVLWAIFVPLIWYVWLAFDGSRWNEAAGAPRRDILPAPEN